MKSLKNIARLIAAGAIVIVGGCEPIEERENLSNSFNPADIRVEAIQTAGGVGNGITLKMNTPGVNGYWDFLIDKRYSNEAKDIVFPIRGTHTFTFYVSSPYIKDGDPSNREYISKSIDVTIEEMDQPLPEAYYHLIGDELTSKTWVFDRESTNWWYMSSGGPEPPNPHAVWWNASECCAPSDQGGKMVFDLNGAANYTYYPDKDGEPAGKGTFSFNSSFTKFYIGGGLNILGAEGTPDVNGCALSNSTFAEFEIVELSAEKLILYIPDAGCDSGWTWVFVPAE
jgi:hypothetical protein